MTRMARTDRWAGIVAKESRVSGRGAGRALGAVALALATACSACATGQSIDPDEGVPAPGTTPWTKLDTDPEETNAPGTQCTVFSLPFQEEVRDPWVVESAGGLRMYYGVPGGGTIGMAESPDGIEWGRGREILGATLAWEGGWVGAPALVREGESWRMWYGGEGGIGLARSADGVRWEKASPAGGEGGPVLEAEADWEGGRVGSPSVAAGNGSDGEARFKMWYEGGDGAGIGIATSDDGEHWSRPGESPIVERGGSGEWDSDFVGSPHVLPFPASDGTTIYRMWYAGAAGGGADPSIGEAASEEGVVWRKNRFNPVVAEVPPLTPGGPVVEREPAVLAMPGAWMMWFSEIQPRGLVMPPDKGICLATKVEQ